MMDRFAQHDNDKDLPENLLDQFREKDRETVRQIWELLPEVDSGEADITNHETEEALARLNRSLGQSEMDSINTVAEPELQHTLRHHRSQNGRMDRKKAAGRKQEASTSRSMYGRIITLKWLAAAAVLITIGAGWLWLPKTVTIPHGQIASITLPDGSNVELNSGSELRYSRLFSYTHRNIHLNGEAWFGVAQGDDPFVVESNGAVTQVTGTSFNVRSWRDDPDSVTEVTVSSGEVEFYPAEDPEKLVTLTPERMSRWSTGMAQPSLPELVDLDQILGWRELKLTFHDKPLKSIFRELERRYDVRIVLTDPALQQETLTAFYVDPGSVESVLNDICTVKGLRYTSTANGFRVYKPEP